MIVEIKNNQAIVTKEKGDPTFRDSDWGSAESRLLYHMKKALNAQGYDFIKKLMHKDGHLVSDNMHYLRIRKPKEGGIFCIWDGQWAIRNSAIQFNTEGSVSFLVEMV